MRARVKTSVLLAVALLIAVTSVVSEETPAAAVEGHDSAFIDGVSGARKITVRPTGVDDTANIRWALENVAARGTVRLDEGHFIVTESTVIQPHGVDIAGRPNVINSDAGVFKGADREDTVIEARRRLDGSGFGMATDSVGLPYSTMFSFSRPEYPLTVKGMTLAVSDVNITDPFVNPFNGELTSGIVNVLNVGDLLDDNWLPLPMLHTPVVLKDLSIRGLDRRSEFGSDEEYAAAYYGRKNVHYGLITIRMTNVVMKNCHVEHASGDAIEVFAIDDNAKATINNCTAAHGAGISMYWVNAARTGDTSIKGNTLVDIFDERAGVELWGVEYWFGPLTSSNVVIKDNDFTQSGKTDSFVGLFTFGGPVSGNTVKIEADDLPDGTEGPASVILGPGVTDTRVVIDDCDWVLDLSEGPTTCKD